MSAVEDYPHSVAFVYHEFTKPAQSTVGTVEATVAQLVVGVVRQEPNPQTRLLEGLNAVEFQPYPVAVLCGEQEPGLPVPLGLSDVVSGFH
jgi:hypothetical protein